MKSPESHLNDILDSLPIGVFEIESRGHFTFANRVALGLFGGNRQDEMTFPPPLQFVGAPSRARLEEQMRRTLGGEVVSPVEFEVKREDGSLRCLQLETQPVWLGESVVGVRGVVTDVSRSGGAEVVVGESEARFQALFQNAPDGVLLFDGERILSCNARVLAMLGYSEDAILGLSPRELSPPTQPDGQSSQEKAREKVETALSGERQLFEWRHQRADGTLLDTEVSLERVELGGRWCLLAVLRDVTERKRAEDELSKTQGLLLAAIEQTPAGMLIADAPDVRIRVANPAALGIRGESAVVLTNIPAELHPRRWQTFWPDGTPVAPEDLPLSRAVLKGERVSNVEVIIRRGDGEPRVVLANAAPVRNAQGEVVAGVVMFPDITDLKRAQTALQASEDRARRQREAIAGLVLDEKVSDGELPFALQQVTRKLTETFQVERTSVWVLSEDQTELKCLSLFEASKNLHSAGTVLRTAEFPGYFEAIKRENRVAVNDVLADPRVAAIGPSYLRPLGISSLLDAGIQVRGKLAGVVSVEHAGPARAWYPDEEAFISTAAALVADIFTNAERKRAEKIVWRLSELGRQLSAATHATAAAQAVADAADELLGWDACFLKLRSAGQREAQYVLSVDLIDGKRQAVRESEGREVTEIERRVMDRGAQLILREDPESEERFVMYGDVHRPTASLMYVPLRHQGKYLGILSIQSYQVKAYKSADLELLQTLADHAAGALERIRAEEAFHGSEERYSVLVNSMKDLLYSISIDGRIRFIGPQVRVYGYTAEELVGRDFLPLIHPEDRSAVLRDFTRTATTGEETQSIFRLVSKDGSVHWLEDIGRAVRDQAGANIAVSGTLRDITERKRSEEALQLRNVLLSSQQEASIDGILAVDETGGILSHNRRFVSMWEIPEAIIAQGLDEPVLRFVATRVTNPAEFLQRVVDLYARRQETSRDELTLVNGRVFDRYTAPMFGPENRYYGRAWYFRDVTERKRLEAQLRQAQKLEAVGQLAGGVAHDFNNILAALMMNLGLMQMNETLDGETRQALVELDRLAERAATLTRQLLMFSRRSVLAVKPVNVNEVVTNLLKMLERLIGEQIDLRFDGKSGLPPVEADTGMMEQVLMNLVVNARDAMPQGGRITVSTALKELTGGDVGTNPDRRQGRFVCLAVADTGVGMDAQTMKRIFEPFFTTKEPGKGTGLGLATVHGIVAQHKGWVEVESELGKGTTFSVWLPAIGRAIKPAAAAVVEPPRGGKETILLAEDDANVRRMVGQALRALGYSVREAANGQQAMELWQTCGGQVDLLLTDMVMPEGMTGLELAEKLQALKPGLKAIISSGYSSEIVQAGITRKAGVIYLPKPYQTATLAKAVRERLDSKS